MRLPATFLSESPITDIPNRNIATPPSSDTMLVISIFFSPARLRPRFFLIYTKRLLPPDQR